LNYEIKLQILNID